MKNKILSNLLFLTISLFFLVINSCKNSDNSDIIQVAPQFSAYISAYTSGVISNKSEIIVELKNDLSNDEINKLDNNKLFDIEPKITGETQWINNRTIRFTPNSDLSPFQLYKVTFHLSKVLDVPSNMRDFVFQFQTKNIDLNIYVDGLSPHGDDLVWQKVGGFITTTDRISKDLIKQMVAATQNSNKLNIRWLESKDVMTHNFIIDSIKRTETRGTLEINWDGDLVGVDKKGKIDYEIPPLGDFKIMDINIGQLPDQFIKLRFSDPLRKNALLDGLIYFESGENIDFSIDKNVLTIYPKEKLVGEKILKISNAVKNNMGYELSNEISKSLTFTSLKPEVKLIGDGVILPSSNGLIFPFKSVNLNAVNVKIIRIYEDNVGQFFQNNNFNGRKNLTRVGRIIYKDDVTLNVTSKVDLTDWNTYSLDLSKMIKTEPGAIYRVMISFKMSQSLYPCDCDDNSEKEVSSDFEEDYFDQTQLYWYSDNNYNYGNKYYNWRERSDPCKLAYYASSKNTVVRNVFASDLGIMVKSSDNGRLMTIVTDLKTTEPQSGVKIELYNLQNRLISSQTTSNLGIAKFNLEKQPYLLIAKRGKEIGYLKLDDGSSLSMSMFDISGSVTQDGIKGYIYGDRGVWRPGDSLFLSFILEDKNNVLPADHPVIFTLYNSKGQLYQRLTRSKGENGFYVFKVKTSPEDETGNWKAEIKVGDAVFTKQLKIETIKPNRLKVDLNFGTKILTNINEKPINLSSNWLHGAPAKGLKTDIEINLFESTTRFKGLEKYHFDDYIKNFKSQDIPVAQKILSKEGKTSFTVPFKVNNDAPGMLTASFKTRVFEKGGDVSTDRILMPFSPYRSYVGFSLPVGNNWSGALYSDSKNLIPIVSVNEFGELIDRKNIKIEIFKISWNWWWQTNSKFDVANYVTGLNRELIHSGTVSTKDGKAIYELDLKKEIWGRCYIRLTDTDSKHSSGKVFYLSYSDYWSSSSSKSEGAEILSFNTDKEKYSVGENIKITLPEAKEGRIFISVESGNDVLDTYWFKASKTKNTFSLKATANMAPNVYLNITFIQPHKYTENDLPIRMFGVRGISVEDPNTHLTPIITMKDELRPLEEVTIKISEKNKKKMTYTIAVVDDGLLDLTRFTTPNPWNTFYAKQSLGVKTWDMYKYVTGAFTGKMAGLLQIGGDIYTKSAEKKQANRFKPIVKFLGPFTIEPGNTAKHTFKMPNYVGSVRTMVVAGNNTAYGSAQKTTKVKKPLMVLASLPRVLGPDEEVEVPINVFAMKENIKKVKVSIKSNDMFEVVGNPSQIINFESVGDKLINFKLKVKDKLGIGTVKIICESGKEIATYDVELSIRIPNPTLTKIVSKAISAGDSWSTDYKTFGIEGTNNAILEFSTVPPINLEKRLDYLIQYPHGCIEQTISSVFPQLFLSDLLELSNNKQKSIQDNIEKALIRIKTFQTSSGGFTYWPNSISSENDWGTNYAGHFLIEASKKGFQLPIGLFKKWLLFQTEKANAWQIQDNRFANNQRSSQLNQAYRLYTLALADKPALSAMNKLRNNDDLSDIAKWRLAAAYTLIGRKDVANDLIFGASKNINSYNESSNTFGSKTRDEALILETLVLMNEYDEGKSLIDNITKKLASDDYLNTQATAFSLLSISKYIGASGNAKSFDVDLILNSKLEKIKSNSAYKQIDLDVESKSKGNLEFKNINENMLFVSMQMQGIPMYDGLAVNEDNNINMKVNYFNMNNTPLEPYEIEQGSDFYVETSITNTNIKSDYQNLALTQIFPSGWEIRNTRMDLNESISKEDITYQDIRDDRVLTYFDLKKGESIKVKIQLNASYLGRFYLPIVNCEAMYDNTINANEGGGWVKVVKESVK